MTITILGIESSCDDTAAAVIKDGKILANITAVQLEHEKYGGVIPESASRAHLRNITPVVSAAIKQAKIHKNEFDAVAFTRGPGLLGSLMVGCTFAKSYALGRGIPIIDINHMQAHISAHFIDEPKPKFPFICLTVSGGHTQLVRVDDFLKMTVIGETTDDAVGEAFDKSAKMLGLPYPGGPLIDQYAESGNPEAFKFPKADVAGLNFSFSGFKTAVLYFLRDKQKADHYFVKNNLFDISASIRAVLVDTLLDKLKKAAEETGIREIAVAGGVSANLLLRKKITETGQKLGWNTYIPKFEYCTDNAAMIAAAGHYRYLKGDFCTQDVSPDPRMPI